MRKLLLILFPLIAVGIIAVFYFSRDVLEQDAQIIGGNKDQYGCLGAAGFSYDPVIQACARIWELEGNEAARLAVAAFGAGPGLTVVSVTSSTCSGCFTVELSQSDRSYTATISNFKVDSITEVK